MGVFEPPQEPGVFAGGGIEKEPAYDRGTHLPEGAGEPGQADREELRSGATDRSGR